MQLSSLFDLLKNAHNLRWTPFVFLLKKRSLHEKSLISLKDSYQY